MRASCIILILALSGYSFGEADSLAINSSAESIGSVSLDSSSGVEELGTKAPSFTYVAPRPLKTSERTSISAEIATGRTLAIAGAAVHAAGFAGGIISSNVTFAPEDELLAAIVLYGFDAISMAGPILSCAGASTVETGLSIYDFTVEKPVGWREYGIGWAFSAGAIILRIISGSQMDLSVEAARAYQIGSFALDIIGEYQWVNSIVHSIAYIDRNEKNYQSYRFSIRPSITTDKSIGLQLTVNFN